MTVRTAITVGEDMEVKSCRVTISGREGVAHSGQITAATLYEAVALSLRSSPVSLRPVKLHDPESVYHGVRSTFQQSYEYVEQL